MHHSRSLVAGLLALAGSASLAGAQENTRAMRFGLLAGISSAEISEVGIADFAPEGFGLKSKRRNGGQVAAFVILPLGSRFALQPELHYVQKGTKLEIDGPASLPDDPDPLPVGAEFTVKLAYLEAPILARLDLGRAGGAIQPFLVAGPSIALRGSCQYGFTAGNVSAQVECEDDGSDGSSSDSSDPVKKYEYGAVIGGGVNLRILGIGASLQARYGRSLSDLFTQDAGGDGGNARNRNLSFLIGVGF